VLISASLQSKVRELYNVVCRLEEEKYDWEFKLRKMDFEVHPLLCVGNECIYERIRPVTDDKLVYRVDQKSEATNSWP